MLLVGLALVEEVQMSPKNRIVITKREADEVIWSSSTSAIDNTGLEEVAVVEAELLIFLLTKLLHVSCLTFGSDGGLPTITSAIVLASRLIRGKGIAGMCSIGLPL